MKEPRTYSLSTLITVAMFTLGFGIGAGIVIGRGPPPDPGRASGGGAPPQGDTSPDPSAAATDDNVLPRVPAPSRDPEAPPGEDLPEDLSVLQQMLIDEMEESERLKEQVAELQGKVESEGIADARRLSAEEVFDRLLKLEKGEGDPDEFLSLVERLKELGEDEAAYFIGQYLANVGVKGSAKEREVALMLAVLSGGDRVADFLNEFLNDPTMPAEDRRRFLSRIGHPREPVYSMDRIPLTGGLAQTAFLLLQSEKPLERRGAAGMLGGLDTPQSRSTLEFLLQSDRDWGVRIAAIHSLGRIGDLTTMQFLSDTLEALAASPNKKAFKRLRGPLRAAIRRIEKRYS